MGIISGYHFKDYIIGNKPSKIMVLFFCLFMILLSGNTFAQTVSGRSAEGYVNITKEPPKPPYLEVVSGSLEFTDADGNRFIDANEQTAIKFQLRNTGAGEGLNITAKITGQSGVTGLTFSQSKSLGNLLPGKTLAVEIPVTAGMNTLDGTASFSIAIDEANGFGTDPVHIEVPTRAFLSPMVKVVDYKVTSQEGTTIQKKKTFEVQVLVQNLGQGVAEDIMVTLPVPENMYCLSENASVTVPRLNPGDSKLIDYSLIANNNYTQPDIRLDFKVTEKYRKYAEGKQVTIAMNQQVTSEKLVVTGMAQQQTEIKVGSLSSAVDKNIPVNTKKYPYRVALIIGNEDYSGSLNAEINVPFARNDAQVFHDYALNTLGVETKNIYFITDATAGEMRRNIDLVAQIVKAMGSSSELIFYYAGHGYPDETTKVPYLVPVDVNATNLTSAIRLSEVYEKFGNAGAQRVTVFLDACFSGGGRNMGLMAARSVKQVPREETVSGNMVVFTASTGEQSSLPYNNEQHGMFTYFLLKKLQETKGMLTYRELENYLKTNISLESLRVNGKNQDPEVIVSSSVYDSWGGWKFTGD